MGSESKVEYLIVDTSAFIKNAALQDIGNTIITEPAVQEEVTSKRQLRRLVVLPYDLQIKEAYPEDIQFVTEFSKKTGDYASLSATDIKVIALTYRYERERVGISHLRQEPEIKREIKDSSDKTSVDQRNIKVPIGFYKGDDNFKNVSNDEDYEEDSCENKEEEVEIDLNLDEMIEKFRLEIKDLKVEDLKMNCDNYTADDILKPVKDDANEAYSVEDTEDDDDKGKEEEDDDNDDDDESWITPKNYKEARKKINSEIVKEKPATVACLTMDYAMQNVLMQIGLNVASLEGKVIKEMRTFILRCYSCFKTTGIVTKLFCPHCGNKTLKKVAVSLDDKGNQIIHINFKKPLTTRGKKFSLPTYQGGKHACNPILFEDQPMPHQMPTKLARTRNDPLHEDFLAGFSPFVTRDINSRAAMLNIRSDDPVKHWMRRNPNQVVKHRK